MAARQRDRDCMQCAGCRVFVLVVLRHFEAVDCMIYSLLRVIAVFYSFIYFEAFVSRPAHDCMIFYSFNHGPFGQNQEAKDGDRLQQHSAATLPLNWNTILCQGQSSEHVLHDMGTVPISHLEP